MTSKLVLVSDCLKVAIGGVCCVVLEIVPKTYNSPTASGLYKLPIGSVTANVSTPRGCDG